MKSSEVLLTALLTLLSPRQEIPVPECSARYPAQVLVGEMCNSNEVDQCGDHMTCVQVSSSIISTCPQSHICQA